MCVLRVYVALIRNFYLRKLKKNMWSNCCLWRVRRDWKFLENTQNGWLCEILEYVKYPDLLWWMRRETFLD